MTVSQINIAEGQLEESTMWTSSCALLKSSKSISITATIAATGLHLRPIAGKARYSGTYHLDEIASCAVVPNEAVHQGKSLCMRDRTGRYLFENDACLQVTVYVKKPNSKRVRRSQFTLVFRTQAEYEANLREANLFQAKVDSLINTGKDTSTIASANGNCLGHAHLKPILVILNPHSGKGKTVKLFQNKVQPMLDDSNIGYHILITKYANHALEFIQSHNDLSNTYSTVVTVSGDGLLFEVMNGFVSALEQSQVKSIPIPLSIIPGGSGNGLAHSINSLYLKGNQSSNDLLDCTLHVIKGQPRKMDLVRVVTPNKVFYSFLSFGWGLMADIDIESERLRCLGEPRFTIWSIYRSMALRKYSGTLSYLHKDESSQLKSPLDCPLSEPWVSVSGNFVLVYAAYQRYLNSTCKFAPDSKLDDETIYLLYIKEGVSSCQVIQFLLALEDGLHIKLPYVNFVPVKAFRLVPDNKTDIITVDGEQIECSPVQAEVIPKMASILMRS